MELQALLHADYLDIIYDQRNKNYGGYELRRHYNERVIKAMTFIFIGIDILLSFSFINSNKVVTLHGPATPYAPTIIDLKPKVIPKAIPAIQPPPPPVVKAKLFTVPKIEPDDKVTPDKSLTENKKLVNAQLGFTNRDGDSTDIGIGKSIVPGPGILAVQEPPAKPVPWVQQMPQFIGDIDAYIGSHLQYPEAARLSNIEGPVLIRFVVNEDGSVSDAMVVKGIGGGCDEEALRMVSGMPKWKPGKQNGIAVKVYFSLPIRFELADR